VSEPTEITRQCGNCAYFHSERWDAERDVFVGECSFGSWPPVRPETSSCVDFTASGTLSSITQRKAARVQRRGARDVAEPAPRRAPVEIEVDMDEQTFRTVLREILQDELALSHPPIGERWKAGTLVLKPGREGTQDKQIPIEAFFHKIVMIRDKLRVLEQKINGHKGLSPEDKVTLQGYITGVYGTLTTFNVLFREDSDHFVGQSSDRT